MEIYLKENICGDIFQGNIFEEKIFVKIYFRANICAGIFQGNISDIFEGKYLCRYI